MLKLIPLFLLVLGVVLVNGWTDAPNSVATCITTRCLTPKKAIMLSAIFNLLGVIVTAIVNNRVAYTIKNLVTLSSDSKISLSALSAALISIILWASFAFVFGIPTSESHALTASLAGVAVAVNGKISAINKQEIITVFSGFFLSLLLGFIFGYVITKCIECVCKNKNRQKMMQHFKNGQIIGSCASSFMHGAQDGQKFFGIMMLVLSFSGTRSVYIKKLGLFLMVLISVTMSLGTSLGGYKIIKSIGMDMVKLEKHQGFSADISSASALLVLTLLGIPVSTTHTKTASIMGVGASRSFRKINVSSVMDILLTWILTFPACALIGFVLTKAILYFVV